MNYERSAPGVLRLPLTRRDLLKLVGLGVVSVNLAAVIDACQSVATNSVTHTGPAKQSLTVAISSFGQESTAKWEGSLGMLPYIEAMYDPLIAPSQSGQLSSDGIISKWIANAAGDEFTLTVRPNVLFHNGDEVTSADIKFSIQTFARTGLPNTVSNALRGTVASIATPDKYTAVLSLRSPNASLPQLLSWIEGDAAVVPANYFNSLPGSTFLEQTKAFEAKPIGTGPFKFISRQIGQSITFQRNDAYFNKQALPKFQQLTLLVVSDITTRMNMLRTGQADVIEGDSDRAIQAQKQSLKPYFAKNVFHGGAVFMQSYDPSFADHDVRVREAMILSVDRAAIVKGLFPSVPGVGVTGTLAQGPLLVGPGVAGYSDSLPSYPYDPNKAKQLLQQAGYTSNSQLVTAWSFPVTGFPAAQPMLEGIVEYWKAVGINAQIQTTDGSSVIAKAVANPEQFHSNDVMMVAASWRPSGLTNLRVFATSKKLGTLACFADQAKIDGLVSSATVLMNPQQYDTAMTALWKSIVSDYWALPMVWADTIYIVDPKVIADFKPTAEAGGDPAWRTIVPAGT